MSDKRLNILMLTPQLPYPPHQGASLRSLNILKGLAEAHQVTLISLHEPEQDVSDEALSPLKAICHELVLAPMQPRSFYRRLLQLLTSRLPDMAHRTVSSLFDMRLRQKLAETIYDVVQVEAIELARVMPLIRQASPASKILFDDINAETLLQRRAFQTDLRRPRRWPAAVYSWIQTNRLRRFERWACLQADWVTAVSQADKESLEALCPERTVHVIPNSIDVAQYEVEETGQTPQFDLIFTGKMDYRPNIDAMLWFCEQIWPRILEARPATTLAIVGQRPHERLAPLEELPGVTLTGFVERIQPFLQGAKLMIMPFRMGSGTRLKLIEAMASGRAVVSTPVGAEGYPVRHYEHLLLANTPQEFSAAVISLLSRDSLREQIAAAGREFARQYDYRVIVPKFLKIFQMATVSEHT